MAKKEIKEGEKNKGGAPLNNKNAVGNSGGGTPMFTDPKELQDKVDAYFEYVKGDLKEEIERANAKTGATQIIQIWNREPEPLTVTGLALFLGFEDRQSLYDYQKKVEFSCIIKKARTKVENGYEKSLHSQSPTGAIFALKNMGWNDKVIQEQTGPNGGPIQTEAKVDLKELSIEELELLKKLKSGE